MLGRVLLAEVGAMLIDATAFVCLKMDTLKENSIGIRLGFKGLKVLILRVFVLDGLKHFNTVNGLLSINQINMATALAALIA